MANYPCVLLFFIILKVSFTDACINANGCPPYKPFCSNSGCVKECPVPFYKNNSECVHNCGDMFVEEDRTCVQTCSNTEFIDETLKFLRQEFIERKCVKSCPYFIFDNTCTNVCPPSSKLIMGDDLNMAEPGKRLCVERCPDTHLYKTNVTHGTTLATFCSKKCNVVVEDGYCVNICPGNKVYFNNSCVFSCPLSRPVLNKQRVCTELCTENINVETSTCNCPPGTFLASNTCLQTCPETMPYYCSFGTSTYTCYKTGSYPKSEYNNKFVCNTRCPNYIVDGKCLDKCPLDKPYTFNNVSLINCWYESCSGAIWENNCVNVCPDGYFTRNDGCTKTCENDEYVYNKSCLRHCPHDMKSRPDKIQYFELQEQSYGYVKKSIQKSTNICTELCADNEYQEDNICVTACPVFAFRKKCISECPKNALYTTAVVLRTCEQESCYTNYKLPMHTSCSEKCLTNMFSLNNSCVHYCPKPYMTAGRMCVLSCPKDLPYENATLFSIKEWREIDDTWSYKTFVNNIVECVSKCNVRGRPLNAGTFTCVDTCSDSSRYVENNVCKTMCSKNFVSNQEAFGIECRLSCPNGKLLFNQTCLKKCPEEAKYNFDGVCLTECPPESPYSVIDMANRCVERCYYDTLYLNSQCVPRYQCNDSMIEFEGLCLELCPEGYRSFSGECLKDINVIAALLVILAILVTGCGYTRIIIVDYGRVCRLMCTRGIFKSQSFLTILEESGAVHLEINTDTPRAFEHENVIDEEITLL